jgi:hypothetical protein
MQQMWHKITAGNVYWCDRNTIEKLEGLAPRWSSRDRSVVQKLFSTGQIFPRVRVPSIRAEILRETLAVEGFILTFRTFFKHIKVLGPIMLRLRELFPSSDLFPPRDLYEPIGRRYPSIKDILLHKYYNDRELPASPCLLQYSDQNERYIETPNSAIYSYWQLCLSLLRHEQGNWRPLKGGKYQQELLDYPEWLIKLGQLARKLGFESDKILLLCREDPDLSQIRLFMREERPNALYSVSSGEFDAAARSRQQGQEIFKRLPDLPLPLMTTDGDTSITIPRTHRALFLPTIWSALTQESRYALTEFGKLLLVLTTFFGDFGPSHGASDYEASKMDVSPYNSQFPVDDTEQEVANIPRRSSHERILPDAASREHVLQPSHGGLDFEASEMRILPSPLQLALDDNEQRSASYTRRSSSDNSMPDAQSMPMHPTASADSSGKTIVFWHLPASSHELPIAKYTCPASKDRIRETIRSISAVGDTPPVFTMVAKNGQLQICPPEKIYRRRNESSKPQDIYYLYGKNHLNLWILKKLPKLDLAGRVPRR